MAKKKEIIIPKNGQIIVVSKKIDESKIEVTTKEENNKDKKENE